MARWVDLDNPKIINEGLDKFGNVIYGIPPDTKTADVRPVVLCKECKYTRTPDRGDMAEAFIQGGKLICSAGHDFIYPSLSWQTIVDENHFCAYGERKDSDG